jgi:hypothetical protein
MLFMVIERFADNDMVPVYQRLRDQGRGLPEGLEYLDRQNCWHAGAAYCREAADHPYPCRTSDFAMALTAGHESTTGFATARRSSLMSSGWRKPMTLAIGIMQIPSA